MRALPRLPPTRREAVLASLSLVALAGVVALVLVYEAPQPKRDVHIEILRTKPAPVTVPGQAHAPSELQLNLI